MMRVAGVLPTVFLLLSAQVAGPGALGQDVGTRPERTVLYVDKDATGPTHDGWTWCTAFTDLQDALDIAMWDVTIRVADGTYTPDRGTGDRGASFRLTGNVVWEGGYAGCGESDPNERDIDLYETILSGDLDGDDIGDLDDTSRDENTYHVVSSTIAGSTGILDGFTITGGYANGTPGFGSVGAGMFSLGSSPTVLNCKFIGNRAAGTGGAMHNVNGSPIVADSVFVGNMSDSGGGAMSNQATEAAVSRCVFSNNTATEGGAIYNTTNEGGAISREPNGNATFRNCSFIGNSAEYGGGIFNHDGNVTMRSCLFSGVWP